MSKTSAPTPRIDHFFSAVAARMDRWRDLNKTAQAWAALRGRDYVLPDDVKALAAPTLAHRLILQPQARLKDLAATTVVAEILASVPVETGPAAAMAVKCPPSTTGAAAGTNIRRPARPFPARRAWGPAPRPRCGRTARRRGRRPLRPRRPRRVASARRHANCRVPRRWVRER